MRPHVIDHTCRYHKKTRFKDHDSIAPCSNAERLVKATGLFLDLARYTVCYHHKLAIIYFVSVSSSSPNCAFCLAITLSCFLSRAALVFARLASISSFRTLSRAFSALALWIYRGCQSWRDNSNPINLRAQPKLSCA